MDQSPVLAPVLESPVLESPVLASVLESPVLAPVLVVTCTLTGVPEGDRISWCGEEPWHWRCDSQSCLLHSSLLLLELVSALVGDRARVAPGWMAVPSLISLMRVMPALTLTPTLPGLMRVPPSPRAPGTALLGLSGTCWGPSPVLPPPAGASCSLLGVALLMSRTPWESTRKAPPTSS